MQTSIKLLGYPSAGSPFIRSSTYHLVASGYAVGFDTRRGDITGNQGKGVGAGRGAGHGSSTAYQVLGVITRGPRKGERKRKLLARRRGWQGKARGRLARAVGIGLDAEQTKAQALSKWLAPSVEDSDVLDLDKAASRARVLAEVKAGNAWGERLQYIAKRAARKQSQYLLERRGVQASFTSVEDAASDGVLGILAKFRNLDKLTAAHWADCHCLRILAKFAARAAFRSLASWSVSGMTGDHTVNRGHRRQITWGDWATDSLAEIAEGASLLACSLPDGSLSDGHTIQPKADNPLFDPAQQSARRAFIRWVFKVGYHPIRAGARGKGSAAAVKAARSRCLVVANIIQGQSLADACAASGFGSVKAFTQSCKSARFFESLRAARADAISDCGQVECARIAQRRYALAAASAIKQLRYLGAWSWDSERFGVAPAGGGAGVIAFRRLMDTRAHCLSLAKHYKAVATRAASDNLRQFDMVLRGLHSERFGNLRQVFGLVDKRGRVRGASKINPAMIGRARGKVSRKPIVSPTVALPVGRANRALPCAFAAAASIRNDGPGGFVILRRPAAK